MVWELKMLFRVWLSLGLGWEMSSMFRVMLDQRPSNQYPVIQLMNLQSACMTWTYTAMRDQKHEAHVFGSSSSSNYGNLVLKAQFESIKEA
ncbi:hypothetical protein V6N13_106280 [Hibiscus sabdariffa]